MKALIKKMFSLVGLGIYRLNPPQNNSSYKLVISSPIHHNSKDGLNEFYSDAEAVASFLDPGFYDRVLDLLVAQGFGYKQKRVADVGCGTGGLLKSLKGRDQAQSLTGFEYSEKALDLARAQVPGVEFCNFDIYEGSSRKFDVIFCIEVLEHLLHPDMALRNIASMLADSGVALLTVPNGRADTFEGHINFWSPESWHVFVKQTCEDLTVKTGLIDKNNYAVIARNQNG